MTPGALAWAAEGGQDVWGLAAAGTERVRVTGGQWVLVTLSGARRGQGCHRTWTGRAGVGLHTSCPLSGWPSVLGRGVDSTGWCHRPPSRSGCGGDREALVQLWTQEMGGTGVPVRNWQTGHMHKPGVTILCVRL